MKNLVLLPIVLISQLSFASQLKVLKNGINVSRFTVSSTAPIMPEQLSLADKHKAEILMDEDSYETDDALYMETEETLESYMKRRNHLADRYNSSEGDSSDGIASVVHKGKKDSNSVRGMTNVFNVNSFQYDTRSKGNLNGRSPRSLDSTSIGKPVCLSNDSGYSAWRKASLRVEDSDTASCPSLKESTRSDQGLSGLNNSAESELSRSPSSRQQGITIGLRGKNVELDQIQRSKNESAFDAGEVTAVQLQRRKNAQRWKKYKEKACVAKLYRSAKAKTQQKFKVKLFSIDQEMSVDQNKIIDINLLTDLIEEADKQDYGCLKILSDWIIGQDEEGRISDSRLVSMMNDAFSDKANTKSLKYLKRLYQDQKNIILGRGEYSAVKVEGMKYMGFGAPESETHLYKEKNYGYEKQSSSYHRASTCNQTLEQETMRSREKESDISFEVVPETYDACISDDEGQSVSDEASSITYEEYAVSDEASSMTYEECSVKNVATHFPVKPLRDSLSLSKCIDDMDTEECI